MICYKKKLADDVHLNSSSDHINLALDFSSSLHALKSEDGTQIFVLYDNLMICVY